MPFGIASFGDVSLKTCSYCSLVTPFASKIIAILIRASFGKTTRASVADGDERRAGFVEARAFLDEHAADRDGPRERERLVEELLVAAIGLEARGDRVSRARAAEDGSYVSNELPRV